MGANVTTRITGFAQWRSQLQTLESKVRNKSVRQGMRKGAKILTAEAARNAPKRTGDMAKAIKVKAGKRRRGWITLVVQIGGKNYVGKRFYGAFQEFGWVFKTAKFHNRQKRILRRVSSSEGKKIPGKHFMENAAKSKEAEVYNAMVDSIKKAVGE